MRGAADALRQVRHRRELPLASLPALLGAHQLSGAFVWWDLTGRASAATGRMALWLYMVFADVVLSVLVPAAVLAVETDGGRRGWLARFTVVGGAVAAAYLIAMVRAGRLRPATMRPPPAPASGPAACR